MLNIISILRKNEIIRVFKMGRTVNVHKRNIPINKEWNNSIYVFNKNPTRFLPVIHDYVFKLLKSHFNMINENLQLIIKSTRLIKIKRSLSNKVWVSNPEIKHLNKEMTITIYIYNRLYNQYKKELNLIEFDWGPKKNILEHYNSHDELSIKPNDYKPMNNEIIVSKKIKLLRDNRTMYYGTNKIVYNDTKSFYIKIIKWLKLDKYIDMEKYRLSIIKLVKENKFDLLKGLKFLKFERHNYLINQFKKEVAYLKLKQKLLFNEYKFTELYLTSLIDFLETIYVKKIKLNIVMLKYFYLSSSILSQMISAKVISIKNRGQPLKPVYEAMEHIFVPNLSSNKLQKIDRLSIGIQNIIFNKFKKVNQNRDSLDKFLLINNKKSKIWSSKYIDKFVLKNLENKSIAGLFIKLTGRLTKRYKAQRAVNYLVNKGTLKNVYSAHKGFTSSLSRGFNNINIEKTTMHSKVRIGAFGITGWIASN